MEEGIFFKNRKIADLGYYINLDSRQDRREKIESQFEKFEIRGIQRFSAIEEYDSGPLNCKKSHFAILEKLVNSDYDSILILEDDCLFLDFLKEESDFIFENINKTDWDIFWLGCRNRRSPIFYKNNCYRVSSVSHAHSYIVKKSFAEYILNNFPFGTYGTLSLDELLCLCVYGKEITSDPNKHNFYQSDQPLDDFKSDFLALCYEKSLTTQYASYSDLWRLEADYESYIISSFPKV